MAIKIEKKKKFLPYRNAEFIPAYLFIPKELLDQVNDESLRSLPRTLRGFMYDKAAIKVVESDLFLLLICDMYAYMVWPFMCPGEKREIYSGYDPMWIAAHNPNIWIHALMECNYLPDIYSLMENCELDYYHNFLPLNFVELALEVSVHAGMAMNHLFDVYETVRAMPCEEDFDFRPSNQKTDFYRKWYHTQTQHPMISLEGFMADYAAEHNGQEWDIEDESANFENESTVKVLAEQFMETLSEKDKQILQLRLEGYTMEEVADKLGYANHSGVLKRLRKIGQAFEKYADVDYGFDGKRII